MNTYPEDVRQAMTEANTLLEAEDEAARARPPGDWVNCACRLYWSPDAAHQHLTFCGQHAQHANRFMQEMQPAPQPMGVQHHCIADLIAQAAQEQETAHAKHP